MPTLGPTQAGMAIRPGAEDACFPRRDRAIGRARMLVVVPPFANAESPSIGAHIIAGRATDCGVPAEVAYASLSFAALLGVRDYARLCEGGHLLGERIFSRAMFGATASAATNEAATAALASAVCDRSMNLAALQGLAEQWADDYAAELAATHAEIIGFTSTFEQTLASLALAARVKRLAPDKLLIIGGANVDGEMAHAIAALTPDLDHIFSGESEVSLVRFLADHERGAVLPRIIRGAPYTRLDESSPPDYSAYWRQLGRTVSARRVPNGLRPDEIRLPYESSRGCWWGAKHHCTFCGLNALGIGYREKKPEKVLDEIGGLVATHPAATIVMVDNIMPFSYFETLIPELARRQPRLKLFYEQKANLSFARMQMLADAGVRWIQPGIEALDTSLLKLMRKGSSLRSNLDCLRFARGLAIHVSWNLLVDFPGDEDAPYEAMGRIVPYLFHLQPPSGVTPLSIERFSPYFDEAADFEIANIRPIADYELAFPGADLDRLAYHFVGDYASAYRRRPDLVENLAAQVGLWQQVWEAPDSVPVLEIIRLADDRYLICDTRPVAIVPAEIIGMARARLCLTGAGGDEADANWAIERVYVWPADGLLLPLATADEACMTRFLVPGVLPQAIPSPRPVDEAPGTTDVRLAPTRELRPTG